MDAKIAWLRLSQHSWTFNYGVLSQFSIIQSIKVQVKIKEIEEIAEWAASSVADVVVVAGVGYAMVETVTA
jgi:hypothetical protein